MTTLWAGPFGGEFGWEIMGWQGHIRRLSKGVDRVVVACRESSIPLYLDFTSDFIVIPDCDGLSGQGCEVDLLEWDEKIAGLMKVNDSRTPSNLFLPDQCDYIPYGEGVYGQYRVAFCARSKDLGPERNWPNRWWSMLVNAMPLQYMSYVSLGKTDSSMLVPGSIDGRDWPLRQVMDALAGAHLVIGPNSGLIHLASLCQPQNILTWVDPKGHAMGMSTYQRVTDKWNPFATGTHCINEIRPTPETVIDKAMKLL